MGPANARVSAPPGRADTPRPPSSRTVSLLRRPPALPALLALPPDDAASWPTVGEDARVSALPEHSAGLRPLLLTSALPPLPRAVGLARPALPPVWSALWPMVVAGTRADRPATPAPGPRLPC